MPIVIRHAESTLNAAPVEARLEAEKVVADTGDYNHPLRDADLTERGLSQVADLARRAKSLFPTATAVFTSPLRRALRTAIPIARALGIDVHVVPALRETRSDISDVGSPGADLDREFPGLDLDKLAGEWWRAGCTCPGTAECLRCVLKRKVEFKALARGYPDAIFVTHSDLLYSVAEIDLDNAEYAIYVP